MAVTDEAIEQIRGLIVSGRLEPGSRLPPEQQLAARLGLSRSSMREAISVLTHARVLEVRRGDGTYVTSLEPRLLLEGVGFAVELMSDDTLLEVFEVRQLLEPAATALAADRITDGALDELSGHLERMRRAESDPEELVVHDTAFHACVVRAAGNRPLASVLDGLSAPTVRARTWRALLQSDAGRLTITQHEDIYRALQARDTELARAVALVHVTTSLNGLRRVLDQ